MVYSLDWKPRLNKSSAYKKGNQNVPCFSLLLQKKWSGTKAFSVTSVALLRYILTCSTRSWMRLFARSSPCPTNKVLLLVPLSMMIRKRRCQFALTIKGETSSKRRFLRNISVAFYRLAREVRIFPECCHHHLHPSTNFYLLVVIKINQKRRSDHRKRKFVAIQRVSWIDQGNAYLMNASVV